MKLIIGNKNYSSWSLRGWLACKQSGLHFEEILVPMYGDDWEAQVALHADMRNRQHTSWRFLPWHRLQLVRFEQIIAPGDRSEHRRDRRTHVVANNPYHADGIERLG